jgi:hypothetical protein
VLQQVQLLLAGPFPCAADLLTMQLLFQEQLGRKVSVYDAQLEAEQQVQVTPAVAAVVAAAAAAAAAVLAMVQQPAVPAQA